MGLDLKKYKGKTICVAVSGGADSMVLLHFLKSQEQLFGYTVSAVNFEHGIRGKASLMDSQFVKEYCERRGILLYAYQENCLERALKERVSVETAARNFRLERYAELVKTGKAEYIATAHHADDLAETVLFRLCRGASLSGASGIKAESEYFIRPLLEKSKAEILEYARQHDLPYVEDETNKERIATRNVLRLDVLPVLEKVVSGATRNLSRFSSIALEDDEYLYKLSEPLIAQEEHGFFVKFNDEKTLFRRACLTVMKRLGIEKDYTLTHLEDLFSLQFLAKGAKISLPNGVIAKKKDLGVYFTNEEESFVSFDPIPFSVGTFRLGKYEISISEEEQENGLKLDLEKIPNDSVIRQRKEGDSFRKYGGGTKSLKRYLIDKKIEKENRDMPIVASQNVGTVYAIFGVEISEDVKIDQKSKKIVYLTMKKYRR